MGRKLTIMMRLEWMRPQQQYIAQMKIPERKLILRQMANAYIIRQSRHKKYKKSILPRLNELRSTDELILILHKKIAYKKQSCKRKNKFCCLKHASDVTNRHTFNNKKFTSPYKNILSTLKYKLYLSMTSPQFSKPILPMIKSITRVTGGMLLRKLPIIVGLRVGDGVV